MRFNVNAMSLAIGIFWGLSMLIVTVANLIWPSYGRAFLELAASLYPGYRSGPSVGQVITGTLYGFVDGVIGGYIFAWLYNWLADLLSPERK